MTDSCLCKHCDLKIEALDERIDDRFIAIYKEVDLRLNALTSEVHRSFATSKEAVTKAETAQDKRLEGMNEFRAQLDRQAGTFVTREAVIAIVERIAKLERWPWLAVGLFTVTIAVVSLIVKFL